MESLTGGALKSLLIPTSPSAKADCHILYITFDGLLEPLGHSQVLSYIYGLSEQKFSYTLISLERERDLSDSASVEKLERELTSRLIKWIRLPYRTGGIMGVLSNVYAAFRAARRAVREDKVQVIHARSYVAAVVAWMLHRRYGVPYVFDMRGYWIDELADEGRWVTNRFAYKVGKRIERRLLKDSTAIVTLTNIQADDLRTGLFKSNPEKPIEVITTCADYEEFDPARPLRDVVPSEIREQLQGKLKIGLVGSINASYRMHESLLLFQYILEERADAHLLCLTRQTYEMEELLREHGIPESAYTLASATHYEIPDWLRYMDWALLLLNTRYSKRGSMPTKLAEFFAAGVCPVQYGCNNEVSQKVEEAGSGIVLRSLDIEDLRRAAAEVSTSQLRSEETLRARESTRAHFSLKAGIEKYKKLFNQISYENR